MVTHSEHSANQMKHAYHLNDGNLNQQR